MKLLLLPLFIPTSSATIGISDRLRRRRRLVGSITGLQLMDAATDSPVADLYDGAKVGLVALGMNAPNFNIKALTEGEIGSVKFGYGNNDNFRTEGVSPYAFCGDSGGNYNTCTELTLGTHTVTVTPRDQNGSPGTTTTITFEIVETTAPVASPVPSATPSTAPSVSPSSGPTSAPNTAPIEAPVAAPIEAPIAAPPVAVPVVTAPVAAPIDSPFSTPVAVPVDSPVSAPIPSMTGGGWIEYTEQPIEARHEACFVMVGGLAILVGGRGNKDTDIYDPTTRRWYKGSRLNEQVHHMQCVEADGKLWIVSAWTDWYPEENNSQRIFVFDPVTNSWDKTKTPLSENRRRGGSAVVVVGEYIYVSHGNRGGHEQDNTNFATSLGWLDRYNRNTDTWEQLADAPNPRDHTGGGYVNGRICVAGGRNGGEADWPVVPATDCYDPETDTWTVEASIPNPRAGSAYGTTCDGKLIVAGGEGGGAWSTVEVFDGTSWSSLPPLNDSRHGTGLAVDCECNQIHIASGAGNEGGGPELYSLETWYPSGQQETCVHALNPVPPVSISMPVSMPVAAPSPQMPTSTSNSLLALLLIDSASDDVLMSLGDGTGDDPVVNLAALGADITKLNIQAEDNPNDSITIDKVKFVQTNRVEGKQPFAFCGDSGGNYAACDASMWTVGGAINEATAIPIVNGVEQAQVKVTFTIVVGDSPPPPFASGILPSNIPNFPTNWNGNPESKKYPIPVAEAQGAMIGKDFVIISGFTEGYDQVTPQVYAKDGTVPEADWKRMDDMPVSVGITHAAFFVLGSKFFMCGGYLGGNPGPHIPTCLVYDHSVTPGNGQQWAESDSFPDIPEGRGGGGMIYDSATNTAVFVGGAVRPTAWHAEDRTDAWKFNLDALGTPGAAWQRVTDVPFGSNHMSFVTAKDELGTERHFFLGGQSGEYENTGNLKDNYEYVVSTDTWIQHPDMLFTRGHAASSTRAYGSGFIIAAGTTNEDGKTSDISYYDIPSQSWTSIGNLPFALNTPVCDISPVNAAGVQYYHCESGWATGRFSYFREISS